MANTQKDQDAAAYERTTAIEKKITQDVASVIGEFKTSFKQIVDNAPDGALRSIIGQFLSRVQNMTSHTFSADLDNVKATYGVDVEQAPTI